MVVTRRRHRARLPTAAGPRSRSRCLGCRRSSLRVGPAACSRVGPKDRPAQRGHPLCGIVGVPGEAVVVLAQRTLDADLVTGRVLTEGAVVEVDIVMRTVVA